MVNGNRMEISKTIDAVGLFCPMPIVRLKREMEKVDMNKVVELLADDPGVMEDVPAWCKDTGNRCLLIEKNEEGLYVAYVKKERR